MEKMRGLELSRRFYEEFGREMVRKEFPEYEERIAAGLVGQGSECFGYDDEVSRDHDFGPGFCLWLTEEDAERMGFRLMRAYRRLPEEFLGVRRIQTSLFGDGRTGVMTIGQFYETFTGAPGAPGGSFPLDDCTRYSPGLRGKRRRYSAIRWERLRVKSLLKKLSGGCQAEKDCGEAALMARSGQYNYSRC